MANPHRLRRLTLQHWAEDHALAPYVEPPDDWPTAVRLGSAGLSPANCGDHVPGFVGLYAVINGLALLLSYTSPLKPSEEKMLLDLGWKFLAGRGPVAPWHGIRTNIFERMADALTFAISRHRNQCIRCERLKLEEQSKLAITLERLLVAKQVIVILLGHGHYTVLRGYTPLSWLLFDATGRMWIKRIRGRVFADQSWRRSVPFALSLSRSM